MANQCKSIQVVSC